MAKSKSLKFPEGFLWGTAVCSHQAEGHNRQSDWWEFEKKKGAIKDGGVSGPACDMWNRYAEDFDYMKELGLNAFRMSVEWAKLEPRRGQWDAAALEHYAEMLGALKKRGIAVCLTLHHFVLPKWVQDAGGWANDKSPRWFGEFARRAVERLFEYVDIWVTLNEPMGPVIGGYMLGMIPPRKIDFLKAGAAFRNMLRAHAAAAGIIRRRAETDTPGREPLIGIAAAVTDFEAVDENNPLEKKVIDALAFIHNNAFLDAMASGKPPFPFGLGETIPGLAGSFNYVGANYYSRLRIARSPKISSPPDLADLLYLPPGTETTEMGYEVYPQGFHKVLMDYHRRYGKPIYITENGIADAPDRQRPRYILTHLAQAHRAMRDGADIRGYFYWTFIDNFEWLEGWRPKFGLIAMEPSTLDRIPRPSAEMYGKIARANAVTPEIAAGYAPGSKKDIFPE